MDNERLLLDKSRQGSGFQRAIIACSDRLSMPSEFLGSGEIPIALAASDWWIGSGITGSRKANLPIIPWFRWWDFWHPWIHGTAPELLEPAPPRIIAAKPLPGEKPPQTDTPPFSSGENPQQTPRGLLVGLCNSTLEAYQRLFRELGHETVETLRPSEESYQSPNRLPGLAVQSASRAEWLLVDDSVLTTSRGMASDAERLASCVPEPILERGGALLIFCVSHPRWDLFQELAAKFAGQRVEMVAKPTTGTDIRELLQSIC